MSVLSNIDIAKIVNKKDIVINPFDQLQLTGLGYDLKIGCIVDADIENPTNQEDDKSFLLEPKHRYIVATKEYIWLSRKYMGTLHARGSLSLAGLTTTATTVDPNFRGYMLMCVINQSDVSVSINKDDPFITLVIHKLKTETKKPLSTTEDGEPRIAERKISDLFPKESDMRRVKLYNYLTSQEQRERARNIKGIILADMRNAIGDSLKNKWHLIWSNKRRILTFITTIFLLIIIAFCVYSLIDTSFIIRFIPNYTNTNMFQIPAIIAAVAALIALHKKK